MNKELTEQILALRTDDPDEFILACKNAVSMVENERFQELQKANYAAMFANLLNPKHEGRLS